MWRDELSKVVPDFNYVFNHNHKTINTMWQLFEKYNSVEHHKAMLMYYSARQGALRIKGFIESSNVARLYFEQVKDGYVWSMYFGKAKNMPKQNYVEVIFKPNSHYSLYCNNGYVYTMDEFIEPILSTRMVVVNLIDTEVVPIDIYGMIKEKLRNEIETIKSYIMDNYMIFEKNNVFDELVVYAAVCLHGDDLLKKQYKLIGGPQKKYADAYGFIWNPLIYIDANVIGPIGDVKNSRKYKLYNDISSSFWFDGFVIWTETLAVIVPPISSRIDIIMINVSYFLENTQGDVYFTTVGHISNKFNYYSVLGISVIEYDSSKIYYRNELYL